jgi:hypothetical protein
MPSPAHVHLSTILIQSYKGSGLRAAFVGFGFLTVTIHRQLLAVQLRGMRAHLFVP